MMGIYEIQDDDMMGQMQDALGGILFNNTSKPSHKRGRPEEASQETQDAMDRLQKTVNLFTA